MGRTLAEIVRMLAAGIETGSGRTLDSRVVSYPSVRARLARDPERVQSWRLKLYGEVDSRLSVQPGWRLDQLEKLLGSALAAAAHAKGSQARGWSSEARQLLGEIRKELDFLGLATSQAVAHQHLHLHGERPQVIASLARGLAGVLAAGGGDRVAKLLLAAGSGGRRSVVSAAKEGSRGPLVAESDAPIPPNGQRDDLPPYTVSLSAPAAVEPGGSLTVLQGEILDPAEDPDLELELEPESVDLEALAAASIF
jgi:hypothetical protein